MNNDPLVPKDINNSTNNTNVTNTNNNVNTNTVNNNVVGTNNNVNTGTPNNNSFSDNKNIHPTAAHMKDLHGIDTSAFKKSNGPRIDSTSATGAIHAEAFNKDKQTVETLNTDEKKPEKSKVGLILFLILVVAFVIFLPDIKPLISKFINGNNNENITDGELRCSLKKTTSNFDMVFQQNIPFKNSRLQSLKYIETTKGDMNKDKKELDEVNDKCEKLASLSSNVDGFTVDCEFTGDSLIETQEIDYSIIDEEGLTSAFSEVGGTTPEFSYNQPIDEVQKSLQGSGYTCNRIK